LEAAAIAFARQGFAGAAVEQIAESAGFSRGAFYSNFKRKDELFLAPNKTQPKGLHGQ
jgi:AcrR family transcriptional regulator